MTTQMTGNAELPGAHGAISSTLLEARRKASALPKFPGEVPETLDEAYAIQDASRAGRGCDVAGWKVGGIPPELRDTYGAAFLVGPIFTDTVVTAQPGERTAMPVFVGGFAAIEPEFILKLGATREEDRLFIGAEIASSPVHDINGYGPAAIVSDFGNNHGILIGDEVEDWQDRKGPFPIKTTIDGEVIGTRELAEIGEAVFASRDFLLAHAARRGVDVPVGTFISCGAITGVHEAVAGAQSALDFGDLGTVDLELVPAKV